MPPAQGRERADENSRTAHQQLLEKKDAGTIDLYLMGDSIARRWGCTDPSWSELLEHWNTHFRGWNAANFAWGGDTLENILWRAEHGELEGVNPKVIILQGGTNNVGGQAGDADKVARILNAHRTLFRRTRELAPDAKIILIGIFPRNGDRALLDEIKLINEGIATLAEGDEDVHYININDELAGSDGTLKPEVTNDGLHLVGPGYDIWAAAMEPLLTELLGPRAESDNAPPPTGDPSAFK